MSKCLLHVWRRGKVIRSRILKWYCVGWNCSCKDEWAGMYVLIRRVLDGAAARANVDEITASELTTGEWHHFFIDQWRLTLSGTASGRRVDFTPPRRTPRQLFNGLSNKRQSTVSTSSSFEWLLVGRLLEFCIPAVLLTKWIVPKLPCLLWNWDP